MPTDTPRRNAVTHSAEVLAQRPALARSAASSTASSSPALAIRCPTNGRRTPATSSRRERAAIEQGRDQEAQRDIPRALRVLARVQRRVAGDDLAPAVAVGGQRPHDDDFAHGLGAERRGERRDERDAAGRAARILRGRRMPRLRRWACPQASPAGRRISDRERRETLPSVTGWRSIAGGAGACAGNASLAVRT